jgi:NAD-dependent SIR2 family protein deacetylase
MSSESQSTLVESIAACNHLLIVAAAGLSIAATAPNNVYHSRSDFAHHYPCIARYGYGTSYEAMGLSGDASVPEPARVAYTSHHFMNMGFLFPPTPAYSWLLELQRSFPAENSFVWTSNIDRCFERAGFNPARVYPTQGECNRMQCPACSNIWDCESQMRAVVDACAGSDWTQFDLSKRPHCPKCKASRILPNLRGGDWFDPSPYADIGSRLHSYLDSIVDAAESVGFVLFEKQTINP